MLHLTFVLIGAQIEETWEEASSSMKKAGVGIGIINVNRSPRLSDTLGVGRVPSIIGVINGYVTFYGGTVTVRGLKDFVTGLFPSDAIKMVNNVNALLVPLVGCWQALDWLQENCPKARNLL